MIKYKLFSFNMFQEQSQVLWDETGEGAIVDPGCQTEEETDRLTAFISSENITPRLIMLTHAHFDHIYGVAHLAALYGIPVYMSAEDQVILDNDALISSHFGMPAPDTSFEYVSVAEGDTVSFGNTSFTVISTPGHTPGCVCYYDEKDALLISGDTLFNGSIGRTDNQWGDYDKMIVAIMDKLMGLPGEVVVIPGHGPVTDIAYERTHNPFLQPFNEPEEDNAWDIDREETN